MFEDIKTDLLQELEDNDYDDVGVLPMEDIYKNIKILGLHPNSFDEEIRDFMIFMAMRPSKSL